MARVFLLRLAIPKMPTTATYNGQPTKKKEKNIEFALAFFFNVQ
jgi:hypothetical protein